MPCATASNTPRLLLSVGAEAAGPARAWVPGAQGLHDQGLSLAQVQGLHNPRVCPRRRYNTYIAHFKENECMRIALEPTFYEFGVDLVFTGCALHASCPLAATTGCYINLARQSERSGDDFVSAHAECICCVIAVPPARHQP